MLFLDISGLYPSNSVLPTPPQKKHIIFHQPFAISPFFSPKPTVGLCEIRTQPKETLRKFLGKKFEKVTPWICASWEVGMSEWGVIFPSTRIHLFTTYFAILKFQGCTKNIQKHSNICSVNKVVSRPWCVVMPIYISNPSCSCQVHVT